MNNVIQPKLRFPEFIEEWKIKHVSEIFDRIKSPVTVEENVEYRQIGIRSHGKGIFYKDKVTGKELGNKKVFWIEPDVFIVNIVFAWERAVARTTENEIGMIASHRFPMYKPLKEVLDLDFITTLFKTMKGKYYLGLASPGGAGRNKTLGQNEFNQLKLALPSVPEQKKITSFLSAVDSKIEKLEKKKELLSEYKKGSMQKIFLQEIRFKKEDGKEYPQWDEKRLGEVGKTFGGLTGKTKEDFGTGFPFIQYKQIFDNSKIDTRYFNYVKLGKNEKQNKVEFGDVFFTVSSETPNEIGMSSVLLDNIENLYLNSFCFGYRIDLDILSPYFSEYLFRSPLFRRKVIALAQGSTRYNMSKLELMKLSIKLPCLEEQERIATFLSSIDKKIELVEKELEKNKEFKKGLLQQMFV